MSQLVRLEGKHTTQTAHCALVMCEMDIEIEAIALKTFDFDCWQTPLALSSDI